MPIETLQGLGVCHSEWFTLDAARVKAFADTTEDWQFIHLDKEKAAQTPLGGTIAHGFLTLSMLSAMSYQAIPDLPGVQMGLNYGFDRIRFTAPVPVGARVRGRFAVGEIKEIKGWFTVTWDVAVEVEGQERPALVAQWLCRYQREE
jgi:acyl dehydratase